MQLPDNLPANETRCPGDQDSHFLAILIMGMGRRVGRVTPCGPFARKYPRTGAHGVTRPTKLTR
jgi:hypothetical protein